MHPFFIYLQLGFEHIADLAGYDHILFVLALCAVYRLADIKKVLWLVTAFTVGHSVTLALATLDVLSLNAAYIEFMIPVSIVLTALGNCWASERREDNRMVFRYMIAAFFGLIHGMGFSNYLKSLLMAEESITMPLFAFNVGLEMGQLLIVAVGLLLTSFMVNVAKVKHREWLLVLSGIVAGMALTLAIDRFSAMAG